MSEDKRVALIKAAEAVVSKYGVNRLTLNEVAEEAGVSKGGLLYHFPSKDALVKGMLDYAMDTFEGYIERHQEGDKAPGGWLRGYVKGTFESTGEVQRESASASALIASISHNPALLEHYRDLQSKWSSAKGEMSTENLMRSLVVQMATDGLWLNEALGLSPLTPEQREAFISKLVEMTRDVDETS